MKAHEGDWRQAAHLYSLAAERGAPNWLPLALACLKAGDHDGYRKSCETFLSRAAGQGIDLANQAAWLCALAPGATKDYGPATKLAEAAVAGVPEKARYGYLNTLGAVLCRAGRHREAIDRLREGIKLSETDGGVEDWIFLGLAHHALGETEEAKRYQEKVRSAPTTPGVEFSWPRVEQQLLREQLESTLGFGR
jgi:uncharacterized protein HemY